MLEGGRHLTVSVTIALALVHATKLAPGGGTRSPTVLQLQRWVPSAGLLCFCATYCCAFHRHGQTSFSFSCGLATPRSQAAVQRAQRVFQPSEASSRKDRLHRSPTFISYVMRTLPPYQHFQTHSLCLVADVSLFLKCSVICFRNS